MSYKVEIVESDSKLIELESSIGDQQPTIEVLKENETSIVITQDVSILPSEFNDNVKTIIGSTLSQGYGVSIIPSGSFIIVSSSGLQPSGNYSIVGHNHNSYEIIDFNNAVSGLLPVKNILSGSGINVYNNNGNFTVAVTGQFGLTSEEVDDRVSNLLVSSSGISLNYNDSSNLLTISTTGLQPSGNYSLVGHSHNTSDITNLNSTIQNNFNTIIAPGTGIIFSYDENNETLFLNNIIKSEQYINISYESGIYTIGSSGLQPSGNYSVVGHSHLSSEITDFSTSVSGLLPVKNIFSGSGISVSNSGSDFTVAVTGQFGLTSEQVDDRISNLLTAGNYINLNYNDSLDNLIISVTGVQSSGNYSVIGHSHIISDVSGLQNSLDAKQPIGSYANSIHSHTVNDITNFSSGVSGLLPVKNIIGSNYVNITSNSGNFTISVTGLQPSGNYANSIHTHTSNDITDFNSSVSGLLTPYATVNSPNFSGVPTAPTASSGTNNSQIANTQFVRTEISNLVNSAPSTLDTLNELAIALGNDPNFATTITNSLSNKANLSGASFSGTISAPSGDFNVLKQSGVAVSVSGHSHSYSDITNFASGIDANVTTLLNEGSYIDLNYDSINDILTISATGLQPSGNYSVVGHSHTSSNITDFNNSVSGLLPVKNVIGSGYVNVSAVSGNYTVSVSGLQPSGSYSLTGHSHTSSDITNFNTSVSGLLPSISGSGYVSSNFTNNIYTISVSGLQPSGDYSLVGHTHTASNISDFNSSVSGLLPVKDIVAGTGIAVTSSSGLYTINSTVNEVAQAASLVTTVFNKTGSPISKMSAVYVNGGQGDTPTVTLAIATSDMTSAGTYGLAYETINNMSSGKVIVFGALTGLNTDQFNPTAPHGDVNGTVLYLSPTTSGLITKTKPSAPDHIVAIGTIVRTHQNEGVIEVRIQNGFELEELHNVAISGVTNGQFLQYNSASQLWVPSSSGNFSTLQVNGTGVSLSGHTHTSSSITDFNSSVSGLLPVKNILAGTNISITSSSGNYTINTPEEVVEYAATTNFPSSGNISLLYIATDASRSYRWTGNEYVEVGASPSYTIITNIDGGSATTFDLFTIEGGSATTV